MKNYIGNCIDRIDCDALINTIKEHNVVPHCGHRTVDLNDEFYQEYSEQASISRDAGYDSTDAVEFRHYYAGQHFDREIAHEFGRIVDAEPIFTLPAYVSEIRPGKMAPWHWDINPMIAEHSKLGELVRFICFISKPKVGQVFMIEEDCFYYEPQGSIYQYPKLESWHAGSNAGLESKFLFTFTGVKN